MDDDLDEKHLPTEAPLSYQTLQRLSKRLPHILRQIESFRPEDQKR